MEIYLSALCALLGAIIGATGVGIVTYITQRQETRRRIIASLIESGMKEWKAHFDMLEKPAPRYVMPPWVFILVISQYAQMMGEAGKLSDKELKELIAELARKRDLITEEALRIDKEKRKAWQAKDNSNQP